MRIIKDPVDKGRVDAVVQGGGLLAVELKLAPIARHVPMQSAVTALAVLSSIPLDTAADAA